MRSNLLFEPYPGIKDQTCSKIRFKAKRTLARKFLPNSEDVASLQRTHPDAINCRNLWASHSYRWRWTAMAIFSLSGLSSVKSALPLGHALRRKIIYKLYTTMCKYCKYFAACAFILWTHHFSHSLTFDGPPFKQWGVKSFTRPRRLGREVWYRTVHQMLTANNARPKKRSLR